MHNLCLDNDGKFGPSFLGLILFFQLPDLKVNGMSSVPLYSWDILSDCIFRESSFVDSNIRAKAIMIYFWGSVTYCVLGVRFVDCSEKYISQNNRIAIQRNLSFRH